MKTEEQIFRYIHNSTCQKRCKKYHNIYIKTEYYKDVRYSGAIEIIKKGIGNSCAVTEYECLKDDSFVAACCRYNTALTVEMMPFKVGTEPVSTSFSQNDDVCGVIYRSPHSDSLEAQISFIVECARIAEVLRFYEFDTGTYIVSVIEKATITTNREKHPSFDRQ
jgi:hypothetical protein